MQMAPSFHHFDELHVWIDRQQMLECTSAVVETADVMTFTFRAEKPAWFRYLPGQFVTLELPVADEQVVPAPDHLDPELLLIREGQGQADVFHVLRHDEEVGGAADAQGRVEAQGFLETHLAMDLSEHALSPLGPAAGLTQTGEHLGAQRIHITGSQGEHQIPGARGFAQEVDDRRAVAVEVVHFTMAVGGDALGEVARVHPRDGGLAGSVDVHHHQHVGLVEGGEELLPEISRAGVAVRLEHCDDAPVVPRLGGGEGGADLGRMMPVVVHHENAAGFPADLEAALHELSIPATRIFSMADIFRDPHFAARSMLAPVDDPMLGAVRLAAPVPRLSETPGAIRHAGRRVGEDTSRVLRDVAGASEEEIATLHAAGVVFCAERR